MHRIVFVLCSVYSVVFYLCTCIRVHVVNIQFEVYAK